MKKISAIFINFLGLSFLAAIPTFAHVIVTPNQVGIAQTVTFAVAVPTEKDNPTIAVKLLLPDGLDEVVPNVKAGWTVNVKTSGSGDSAKATEIDWTGGIIPPDEKDDFYFSAQVPPSVTTLKWKAYQTYQDGSIVSWDQDPKTIKKGEEGTPYSQTHIVDDLEVARATENNNAKVLLETNWALILSLIALGISGLTLYLNYRKK